jgi:hypothetical protein
MRWKAASAGVLAAVLAGGGACNAISGAGSIDFTDEACGRTEDGVDGGGGADVSLACPAGEAMVGIGASVGGLVVSGFGVCCAPLDSGGDVGPVSDCTPVIGVDMNFTADAGCSAGEAVVRLSYEVDPSQSSLARKVAVACQTPSRWAEPGSASDSPVSVSTALTNGDVSRSVAPCCHGFVARGVSVHLGYIQDAGPYVAGFGALECIPAP